MNKRGRESDKDSSYIAREGVVIDMDEQFISVEILCQSACASCRAKSFCSPGEEEIRVIEVANSGFTTYDIGEKVNLKMSSTLGAKAVWISYVIPAGVLIFIIFVSSFFGTSELASGLISIIAVAIYYFIIWLMRDRFSKEFVFKIEKLG
jgi:Positive regulator of sigma E activity